MLSETVHIKTSTQALRKVPRAKGIPVIGNTLDALRDPLGFMVSLRENYEDVVTIHVGGKNYVVIQSPDACRHILQENAKNYCKPGAARMMKRVMGEGLATSNGDLWLKQRRMMQPAFHRKKTESLFCTINEETKHLAESLKKAPPGKSINLGQAFQQLTLINITKTMFGRDVRNDVKTIAAVINELIDSASSIITSLVKVPLAIPTPGNLRFSRAMKKFDKIIYDIIEGRKSSNSETSGDLLDMLLSAYDHQSNSGMSDQQLKDEITTIFMAGHETTAQTLGWVFYQLAMNRKVYKQVRSESQAYFSNGDYSGLEKLVITKSVIEETMRLYPPVWVIARKAIADDNVNGFLVPANSTILINIYGMNHSSRYWTSPALFNPARFDDESERPQAFSNLSFGGGQRQCIGKLFAMMVMQTVVGLLVQEFELEVPAGFEPVLEPGTTLRARGGIEMLLKGNVKM